MSMITVHRPKQQRGERNALYVILIQNIRKSIDTATPPHPSWYGGGIGIYQIRDLQLGEFLFRLEHHLLPPVFFTIFCLMLMRFTLTTYLMPLNIALLRLVLIYEFTL